MGDHALRLIIWFVMSAISSGGFWLAYRREINRDAKGLLAAQERYHKAGGLNHSLGSALGLERHASPELIEAKEQLNAWQTKLHTDLTHRRNGMLICPGVIAIILLFTI